MVEAQCKNCGAIFVLDESIPEEMRCFCNCEEFEVREKQIIAK